MELDSEVYNFYSYVDDPLSIIDPLGLVRYHRKDGQFGKKRGRRPNPSKHGNAKASQKPAILYAMYDEDHNFQKWGITQESEPYKRYGNTLPEGNTLEMVDRGNRSKMLKLERELTETNPGPLNKESWAGKRNGDTNISNRAKKALGKCK